VLLSEIAEVSQTVAGTSARLAKIQLLAAALREAGPLEVPIAVAYLSGELPQRQIGVGWAALRDGFAPAQAPTLTLSEVDSGFSAIGAVSGKGSAAARKALVGELFGRATADEQRFLVGLLSGELRQGALEGVMTEAVARAADVPVAEVRRAMMLRGSLGVVAAAALSGGSEALGAFGLEVGRPVRPMLATSAPTLADALEKVGAQDGQGTEAALEWKLDGIRIQAHLSGGSVRLFTRTLDDITARLPDVAAVLAKLPVRAAVLDGELIALREDGRPLPFQDTASRTASFEGSGPAVPLSVFLFDALHLEGADLIDLPYRKRHTELAGAVPADLLMPRLVTASAEEAAAFFTDALAHGHEGVVVKSLTAPYAAGRRGAGWIKVKPRHTLDLVVLAVEWGHGRRRGWLSNLHLGARDPDTGGFVMLGKTFKGLTDELLTWQTSRLLGLEERRDSYTVYVRPELVVEIAFDGVQRSPRYPGGLALRFARVLRYREDKTAADADTIDTIRALSPGYLAPDP
jgi:DNA ligase-1